MIVLNSLYWLDLHLLHWIVSVLVPALLLLVSLIYLVANARLYYKSQPAIIKLIDKMNGMRGFGIELLSSAEEVFSTTSLQGLSKAFEKMVFDSDDLYQKRWLPDPGNYFRFEKIFPATGVNSLTARPAAAIFSTGLLSAVVSALLQQLVSVNGSDMGMALIWIPPVTALACSILLLVQAYTISRALRDSLNELSFCIGRHLPLFNDQAGIALLVDQMLDHDYKIDQTLSEFNSTVSRLAENEMADGIRTSIEQVLLESVAPPIQQSADVLAALADELTKRQEQGMQELAGQFSEALAADIRRHLGPVNQELTRMTALMADVKNYIDYAMKALETTRSQSEEIMQDTRQSMSMIVQSREDLSDDFAVFSEQLRLLSQTSEKLALLQGGSESNLSANLERLGNSLEQYSGTLGNSLQESAKALQLADQLTDRQSSAAAEFMELLDRQRNDLAAASEKMSQMMQSFTLSSDQYVKQTLENFDHGLGELIERLGYTVVEIKDAVDALPGALRQSTDYSSSR